MSNIQVQWLSTGIIRAMTKVTEEVIGEMYNNDDLMMNVWIRNIRREIPDTTNSSTHNADCYQNMLEE
jgi:hypothetical protein